METGDEMFVAYPDAVLWGEKGAAGSTKGKQAVNHLLWGDWCKVQAVQGSWVQVRSRGKDGWLHAGRLQSNRLLEVNFVDIGQGDGCHIQTAEDRAIVIDAGEGDNMYRFLRWRFGRFAKRFDFESFVVTHPDKDHYYGFAPLLEEANVHVGTLYHNSIVEQVKSGQSSLGTTKKHGRRTYLSGLVRTADEMRQIAGSPSRRGKRLYPNLMRAALDGGRVGDIVGLLADPAWDVPTWLPGYAPEDGRGMTLRVLGPVPEDIGGGRLGLRRLGNTGVTKNGHSVVLLLEIGKIRMLLGGDLNEASQRFLLEHYTGLDATPTSLEARELLVAEARKVFGVDLAKACHHGSPHVEPAFLRATNPLVTVISSGDDEPHGHPRPDLLGLVGKFSRSERPLIFSTELARSGTESIKHPNLVRRELRAGIDAEWGILADPGASVAAKEAANRRLEGHLQVIERSVASYGMINVRTDGNRMVVAQRLERQRSRSQRWDQYRFEVDDRGTLHYVH